MDNRAIAAKLRVCLSDLVYHVFALVTAPQERSKLDQRMIEVRASAHSIIHWAEEFVGKSKLI
jgi:hypothetical protein